MYLNSDMFADGTTEHLEGEELYKTYHPSTALFYPYLRQARYLLVI